MTDTNLNIGVFDSGIGGVAILKSLQRALPSVHFFYIPDYRYYPYGNLDKKTIKSRSCDLVSVLVKRYRIDLLVVACNTVCTLALQDLRSRLSIPVVGVVPAVKPAVAASSTKVICILATTSTINSSYLSELIEAYGESCQFVKLASPKLVDIAERKFYQKPYSDSEVENEMLPVIANQKIDTVVLACTHFIHLVEEMKKIMLKRKIFWVDCSEAISNRVKSLLNQMNLRKKYLLKGGCTILLNDEKSIDQDLLKRWQKVDFSSTQIEQYYFDNL